MSQTVSNIKIEPMTVTWGEDVIQVDTVTLVADVAGSLNNKYFFIYSTAGVKYHVWFNINSAGSDPAPGGSTAEVVAGATGATAGTLATAAASVIDGLAAFAATASNGVITVTHAAAGYATAMHDGNSGFSFSLTTEGDTAAEIGFTEGEIELSLKEEIVNINSHQTGSEDLGGIRTGKKIEVSLKVRETSVNQLKKLLRQAGGSFTPIGAGPTEVIGMGQYKNFTQTLNQSKKLVLHPVVLGSSDHTRDYTFHLCYAMLDKLTFSGEKIFDVPVTFKCYPKQSLNDRVEYFSFGDGTQTLT